MIILKVSFVLIFNSINSHITIERNINCLLIINYMEYETINSITKSRKDLSNRLDIVMKLIVSSS